MIHLHPIPDTNYMCPHCQIPLKANGWHIPGMRNLADLECPRCNLFFWGDLPSGHGLYYPTLLERETGIVHDEQHVEWFANWLVDSYNKRANVPVKFSIESFRPLNQVVLLNCLDGLYGHCLLKLLNAQYYLDHCPGFDLVVLVPRFLRWLVPDGVAAIWTVDVPLARGIEWNDWLAAAIKRQIEPLGQCWLSVALSHPHPDDYAIERFTRVRPFPLDEWDTRLEKPTVTFIWREDRIWQDRNQPGRARNLAHKIKHQAGFALRPLDQQTYQVATLAQLLRRISPQLDFAVAGLGHPGELPAWITDMRNTEINATVERTWCERYASSHVVIGVHGSNMLLPSAHAGAVVELVPNARWNNLIQDILVRAQDMRSTLYRYRFLPLDTSANLVAEITRSILRSFPVTRLNFDRPWCDHQSATEESRRIANQRRTIIKRLERA